MMVKVTILRMLPMQMLMKMMQTAIAGHDGDDAAYDDYVAG